MDRASRECRTPRRMASFLVTFSLVGLVVALTAGPAGAAPPSVSMSVPPPPVRLEQVTPFPNTYDTFAFDGSGFGTVTGLITPVDIVSTTSGCEPTDFAGFPGGSIALMRRGDCTLSQQVNGASAFGAVAAIIFNSGTAGNTEAFTGVLDTPSDIPAVSASTADGFELGVPGPPTTVLVSVPQHFPGSVPITYTVNRGPKAIRSRTCTLDGAPAPCGVQTASTKNTTTFSATVTGFGSGSHTYSVTVRLTDGKTFQGSISFEGQ